MLSVQTRENNQRHDSDSYKRSSQLSPISDTDIMFDFNVEEELTDTTVSPTWAMSRENLSSGGLRPCKTQTSLLSYIG